MKITVMDNEEYQHLIETFNLNKKYLDREIGLQDYQKLADKYNVDNRGHLAKKLALRGIKLYENEKEAKNDKT